jgi:hypothetical protein|tara:strand:- start:243 stop:434 length:192 start_codon:yes stop_codon:yes gene_type:complete
MPTKYKRSEKRRDKSTGKISVEHFYIKALSTAKLNEMFENKNTPKKLKQKIKNEIVKRKKILL